MNAALFLKMHHLNECFSYQKHIAYCLLLWRNGTSMWQKTIKHLPQWQILFCVSCICLFFSFARTPQQNLPFVKL